MSFVHCHGFPEEFVQVTWCTNKWHTASFQWISLQFSNFSCVMVCSFFQITETSHLPFPFPLADSCWCQLLLPLSVYHSSECSKCWTFYSKCLNVYSVCVCFEVADNVYVLTPAIWLCGEFDQVDKSGIFALTNGISTSFCVCHLFVSLYSQLLAGMTLLVDIGGWDSRIGWWQSPRYLVYNRTTPFTLNQTWQRIPHSQMIFLLKPPY